MNFSDKSHGCSVSVIEGQPHSLRRPVQLFTDLGSVSFTQIQSYTMSASDVSKIENKYVKMALHAYKTDANSSKSFD